MSQRVEKTLEWLVGDGATRGAVQRQVDECSLHDRVTFTGVVRHDAVADYVIDWGASL